MGANGQYDTLEYDCKKCGRHCDLDYYDRTKPLTLWMRRKFYCFHCAFWDKFKADPDRYEVCDGLVYEFGDPLFILNTKSGRVRIRYVWHFDRSLRRLHFSRCIGKVPDDINIPNTGKIIPYDLFEKLERLGNFSCRAIGCYDRYHCYWYDKELREPDGPWNEIPKSHKIGDERCPSFINKSDILTIKDTD